MKKLPFIALIAICAVFSCQRTVKLKTYEVYIMAHDDSKQSGSRYITSDTVMAKDDVEGFTRCFVKFSKVLYDSICKDFDMNPLEYYPSIRDENGNGLSFEDLTDAQKENLSKEVKKVTGGSMFEMRVSQGLEDNPEWAADWTRY